MSIPEQFNVKTHCVSGALQWHKEGVSLKILTIFTANKVFKEKIVCGVLFSPPLQSKQTW